MCLTKNRNFTAPLKGGLITLVLGLVLVSWCYRRTWDHHGCQINFLGNSWHVIWLDSPSFVTPFSTCFSFPISPPAFQSICFSWPLMFTPVFFLPLTQSPPSSVFLPYCHSTFSSDVQQAPLSHGCRSSSPSSSSASSYPLLTSLCAGGLCVRGSRHLSVPWSGACVCGGGSSSLSVGFALGSVSNGRFGGRTPRALPDFVLCFWLCWWYEIPLTRKYKHEQSIRLCMTHTERLSN